MDRNEAIRLRALIIGNFKSAPSLNNGLTANLKLNSVDDWALSVEEVMDLDPERPEQFYMKQMEKIALILGIPAPDSKQIAVSCYADAVRKGWA